MRIATETRILRSKVERAFPFRCNPKLFGLITALGSARASRAGDRALAITNFRVLSATETHEMDGKCESPELTQIFPESVDVQFSTLSLLLARFGVGLQTTADGPIIR